MSRAQNWAQLYIYSFANLRQRPVAWKSVDLRSADQSDQHCPGQFALSRRARCFATGGSLVFIVLQYSCLCTFALQCKSRASLRAVLLETTPIKLTRKWGPKQLCLSLNPETNHYPNDSGAPQLRQCLHTPKPVARATGCELRRVCHTAKLVALVEGEQAVVRVCALY